MVAARAAVGGADRGPGEVRMTGRVCLVILQAGLCATARPACAPLSGFLHTDAGRDAATVADNQRRIREERYAGLEEAEPALSAPPRPVDVVAPRLAATAPRQQFAQGPGWGVREYTDA